MVRTTGARGAGEHTLAPFSSSGPGGLVARDVSVVAGDGRRVLRGVTLEVAPGTLTALVGRNGAGKSTLLRVLQGLIRPDRGTVLLDGRPLSGPDPRVGLVLDVPEDQGVAPVVEDDVAFGLEVAGCPPEETRRRVDEMLARTGLEPVRRAPVHTLSVGQAQKVALAGVLVLGARYLLLDEATAHLSPLERDRLWDFLEDLRDRGTGILLATHRPEEVALADRAVWLDRGEVCFQGPARAFLECPDHPWGEAYRCRTRGRA